VKSTRRAAGEPASFANGCCGSKLMTPDGHVGSPTHWPPVLLCILACACSMHGGPTRPAPELSRIGHVIVLYLENRSFDNLYGEFPGADGLSSPGSRSVRQVDASGQPFATLPEADGVPFPPGLPNAPFDITRFVPSDERTRDLVHRFYQEQAQIDGGRMDRFALISDAKGLVMGYYPTRDLPLAAEARRYTLCDHFFHAAFGGSFLNHIWLIAAATPVFADAPANMRIRIDSTGSLRRDNAVTSDGYVVNTAYSVHEPHPVDVPRTELVPAQRMPTIGDRLSDAGISWAWFAGGWNDATAGHPDQSFQYHHQPFVYFEHYADGSAAKVEHLLDEQEFIRRAAEGNLPAVSFVKPLGTVNEHPGYSDIVGAERHVVSLINAVRDGPNWKDAVIVVTYDENGGFWDHVAPPRGDRWGPRHARAHDRDLALRPDCLRRSHDLRYHFDSCADRASFWVGAAHRTRCARSRHARRARHDENTITRVGRLLSYS